MNIPPISPSDREVLETIQRHWNLDIDAVSYFAAGFGAHHWQGTCQGAPLVFITLDDDVQGRALNELEGAYASAYELAAVGLAFVVASIPGVSGDFIVPMSNGVLSLTLWTGGVTPTSAAAAEPEHMEQTVRALQELHSSIKPPSMPPWRPRLKRDFAVHLSELLSTPWTEGPLGETAREMLQASLHHIHGTTTRFHDLSDMALRNTARWVPTHGEPHYANQMIVDDRLVFVDWETVRLAPKERDVVGIPRMAWQSFNPDSEMLELYKLEWTLCEIDEYAVWFSQPHTGNQDDHDALAKLREELESTYS